MAQVERSTSLEVQVLDQNGAPVEGVPVSLLPEVLLERIFTVGAWDSKPVYFGPVRGYGYVPDAWRSAILRMARPTWLSS